MFDWDYTCTDICKNSFKLQICKVVNVGRQWISSFQYLFTISVKTYGYIGEKEKVSCSKKDLDCLSWLQIIISQSEQKVIHSLYFVIEYCKAWKWMSSKQINNSKCLFFLFALLKKYHNGWTNKRPQITRPI